MQLVAGAAGALLLGPFGLGLTTAGLGFAAGSIAYGVFGPRPRGPGAGDLSAPGLQLGSQIPRVYGRVRRPLTPIWASDFHATEHEADTGKGTPSGPSSYTYDIDMLGVLADGTNVIGVTRIWVNKVLVYTALAESDDESVSASAATDYWSSFELFTGGPSQVPWSVYEDAVTSADAVANRGMCTIGFRGLQCGSSRQPPLVEVEVITQGSQTSLDILLAHFNDGLGVTDYANEVGADGEGFSVEIVGGGRFGQRLQTTATSATSVVFPLSGTITEADPLVMEGVFGFSTDPASSFVVMELRTGGGFSFTTVGFSPSGGGGAWSVTHNGITVTGPAASIPIASDSHVRFKYDPADSSLTIAVDGVAVASGTYSGGAYTETLQQGRALLPDGSFTGVSYAEEILFTRRDLPASGFTVPTSPWDPLSTWTPGVEMLDDIITAEFALVPGIDPGDYDVTDLAAVEVTGFEAAGPPAKTVAELCDVFYVDVVPGNPIRFQQRGAASVATIPYADTGVGVGQPGKPFEGLDQGNDGEISGVKAVRYPNISQDHEAGFERGDRLVTEGPDVEVIDTKVVMTPAQAKGRAITATLMARVRAYGAEFAISDKYAAVEPGDTCTVTDNDGNQHELRIPSLTYADGVKSCRWELEDVSALVDQGITDDDYTPSTVVAPAGVAEMLPMDAPNLRTADLSDAGYYAAVRVSDDSRAYLYESANDVTYVERASVGVDAVFGTVTAVTGTLTSDGLFNESASITVNVGDGTLSSATRAALLADRRANLIAVGLHGRWVFGQYRTATLVSPGVYTLTGLLLGYKRTQQYVASVAVSDRFCLLNEAGGVRRMTRSLAELGVGFYVKAVAARRPVASIAGTAFTNSGESLKPRMPIACRASRDASTGDITLTWLRCTRDETRFGGDLGDAVPLGEESERYRVRIYTSNTYATVARDLGTVTSATASYTGAQQTTDFGSAQATVYVGITQVSAVVGEGHQLRAAA